MSRVRILTVTLALALAGCGTARVVARDDGGGVLRLSGFRAAAASDAHDLMTARCGGVYTVVSEGEETVGARREYRIHFRCGATPGEPHSQYEPPEFPDVPDAHRTFLD